MIRLFAFEKHFHVDKCIGFYPFLHRIQQISETGGGHSFTTFFLFFKKVKLIYSKMHRSKAPARNTLLCSSDQTSDQRKPCVWRWLCPLQEEQRRKWTSGKLPEISQLSLCLSLCLKKLGLYSWLFKFWFCSFSFPLKLAGCWFNNTKLVNSFLWIKKCKSNLQRNWDSLSAW